MSDKKEVNNEESRISSKDILVVLFFLSIAIISLYLFRADLLNTIHLQNVEPVGTVVIKKNTVQRRISDRLIWDRLAKESPVYLGDLIRIANQSEAYLTIDNNTIELYENSLVRIIPSPDGEGLMVQISSGTVSVVQEEGSPPIYIEVEGKPVRTQPGVVMTLAVTESGDTLFEETEVAVWAENKTESISAVSYSRIELTSPAVNSLFKYQDEPPLIQFRWEEIEDAASYAIEISKSYNFSNINISANTASSSYVTRLEEGTWYWRVNPVYPSVRAGRLNYSDTAFFRVEKTEQQNDVALQVLSFTEWLEAESPITQEVPKDVPKDLIPEVILARVEPPPPPPPSPPPPVRTTLPVRTPPPARPQPPRSAPPAPTPIVPLPAPVNLQPINNTTLGVEQLSAGRQINFSWNAVPEANAYIFTLILVTDDGNRQIIRTNPIARTNYTINNLRSLEKGTFVWRVEAVITGSGGTIERRGTIAESTFNIDFPSPTPIRIQDIGVLYGE